MGYVLGLVGIFFMSYRAKQAVSGFETALEIAKPYYFRGFKQPDCNDTLGVFKPFGQNDKNLGTQIGSKGDLGRLLYTLDDFYSCSRDFSKLIIFDDQNWIPHIQSAVDSLLETQEAAHTLSGKSEEYYDRLYQEVLEGSFFWSNLSELWERAFVKLLDDEAHPNASNRPYAMDIITRLKPHYEAGLLKGNPSKPESLGLSCLEKLKDSQDPLAKFAFDFYQRYVFHVKDTSNCGYLADRCKDQDKELYGREANYKEMSSRTESELTAFACRGIAKTIVKFLLEHRNFGGKIPEEVQKIFKDVCVNMADSDFRAIEQNALISCYEIAAILDAKLQELHEKQSSAIAEQESLLEGRQQNIEDRRTSLPQDLEASKQLVTALTAQQGSVLSAEQLSLLKNLSSGLNSSINRLPTEDGLRASEEALVQERLEIRAAYDQIPQLQETLSGLMNNILAQGLSSAWPSLEQSQGM